MAALHLVEDHAQAQDTGGNRHRVDSRPKVKHNQKGKEQDNRRHGDGTGGEGAEHHDASEQGKKKETDLQRVYNKAVSIMRGNQETEGRGPRQPGNGETGSRHKANKNSGYDTKDRGRDDDSRGTGARSGSETPDDDVVQ